jgi:hypothetical protein
MRLALPLLLALTVSCAPPVADAKKPDAKGPFDAAQEKAVRDAVYLGEPMIASPQKEDFHPVLCVPDSLTRLYEDHPQEVLDVLLRVMDGGRPEDSSLAAGYAVSLLQGPGVGRVCVEFFNAKTYDAWAKNWEMTPRQHWIEKVQEMRKKEPPK